MLITVTKDAIRSHENIMMVQLIKLTKFGKDSHSILVARTN